MGLLPVAAEIYLHHTTCQKRPTKRNTATMAKKKKSSSPAQGPENAKPLVIVESPAKARTISKFLGKDFVIEASIGHVRDLPENKRQLPKRYRDEPWAYLGVNVEEDFEPVYVVSPDKRQQVKKLKELLKGAKALYLATDEDREGEAISWHLKEVLQPKVPVHRMVFHEITREAIRKALEHPRGIDESLVRAQETRRILDRLFGYDVSPLLWRKFGGQARSAGRVQSVAVRLIVERERQRMRFRPVEYWDLLAQLAPEQSPQARFEAVSVQVNQRRLATGKDFDPNTGQLKNADLLHLKQEQAEQLARSLRSGQFRVVQVERKPFTSKPAPPFTTSTLQQEANRKLRFSAQKTMQLAQNLYQNGHITYMRTDSTALSQEAIAAARQLVVKQYGPEYLPEQPRQYRTKVKNAQEAHEAIRPAGTPFETPEQIRNELTPDEYKLFELIWKRTIASQMQDARGWRTTVVIEGTDAEGNCVRFEARGKTIEFPGYLRAYVEGADDPEAELADQEKLLPAVEEGQQLRCLELEAKSHVTQPPPRYTDATLTRTLEAMGIGRPSTYATIIQTILDRKYVVRRGNALVPTWTAIAVTQLMEKHFPELVDYQFTARMEDYLDAISRGEAEHVEYLKAFYFGDEKENIKGLKQLIQSKLDEIDIREVNRILIGKPERGPHQEEIYVRIGRYGPFLEQGDRRAPVPQDLAPDELTVEKALELLEQSSSGGQELGTDPETGKPVWLKQGRYGPYVQRGADDDPEMQRASLLRGMKPEELSLQEALKLLSLPRNLGPHPDSGEDVVVYNGRFGPYVKCGDETRSIPRDLSPLDITLQQAVELLKQPKRGGRRRAASREPLKVLGTSPTTNQNVELRQGPYGIYVTDGKTNAGVPKDLKPEDVTLELALRWLEEKAAQGPSRRRRGRKKTTKKTAKKKS